MDIRGIVIVTRVEFMQVVVKDVKKQKRQKWERNKLQPRQETFKWVFYSGSEVKRKHFCGTCKRTENWRTYCDRPRSTLRWNRPSLTSSVVVEEHQDVSLKNTIDEMADATTGGKVICLCALWPVNIPEQNVGILVAIWNRFFLRLWWKSFLKHDVP